MSVDHLLAIIVRTIGAARGLSRAGLAQLSRRIVGAASRQDIA
jgi:hypothetical protein